MPPRAADASLPRPPLWLLLIYQLPARPSNIRVRTWRRLQQVGAVGLKNSAYALPNSAQAKEDFEWIKTEIAAMKGQANVFFADHMDPLSEEEIVAAFQVARQLDFKAIVRATLKPLSQARRGRLSSPIRKRLHRLARLLRERWHRVAAIDFFQASGREEAAAILDELDNLLSESPGASKTTSKSREKLMTEKFRSRTWVTRLRPGIDRMSSAWLIRRFIDPEAKFAFAEKPGDKPDAVPFDMFGVQFSHEGNACTFEMLLRRFAIRSPALERIGQIVHNLDLKDDQFDVPEAVAVDRLVEGLRQIHADDHKLLDQGMEIFEALYRSFTNRPPGRSSVSGKQGRKRTRSFIGLA